MNCFDCSDHHLKEVHLPESYAAPEAKTMEAGAAKGKDEASGFGLPSKTAFKVAVISEGNPEEPSPSFPKGASLLKGAPSDYLAQTVPNSYRKTLLAPAIQILQCTAAVYPPSHGAQSRLDRLKGLTPSLPKESSQEKYLPEVLAQLQKSYSGNLFFISVSRAQGTSDKTELVIRTSEGQILALFGNIPHDHIQEQVKKELSKITGSFVMVYAEEAYFGLGSLVMVHLAMSQNKTFLHHRNSNPNVSICLPYEAFIQFQDGSSWPIVCFNNNHDYVLSFMQISLSEVNQMEKMFCQLINRYCSAFTEMRQAPTTPFTTTLYSLAYNLLVMDNQSESSRLFDKVLELAEFLAKGIEPPVSRTNDELLTHIGNHYPKKMKHCLKCRVCKKNNKLRGRRDANCRKSKYVCEGCTDHYDQKIHLCVECFKRFHAKVAYYMNDDRAKARGKNGTGPRQSGRVCKPKKVKMIKKEELDSSDSDDDIIDMKIQSPTLQGTEDPTTEFVASPRLTNIILQRNDE